MMMKQLLILVTLVVSIIADPGKGKTLPKQAVDNYRRSSRSPHVTGSEIIPSTTDSLPEIEDNDRVPFASGTLPDGVYPNSDFVVYGTNTNFHGFDMYAITGVPNALKCGSQFCFGDRSCTHFAYESDGTCWLKTNFGSGSNWATHDSNTISGMIPQRACDVSKASVASLLNCLSLTIL